MKKSNLKFLKVRAFWVITHYTHTQSTGEGWNICAKIIKHILFWTVELVDLIIFWHSFLLHPVASIGEPWTVSPERRHYRLKGRHPIHPTQILRERIRFPALLLTGFRCCWQTERKPMWRWKEHLHSHTLLGTNISPPCRHVWRCFYLFPFCHMWKNPGR